MSTTITVTSAAELNQALSQATGGETILLAAGDYGTLNLDGKSGFNINYASNVTIKSADANAPATISDADAAPAPNLRTITRLFQPRGTAPRVAALPIPLEEMQGMPVVDRRGRDRRSTGMGSVPVVAESRAAGSVVQRSEARRDRRSRGWSPCPVESDPSGVACCSSRISSVLASHYEWYRTPLPVG